MSDKELRLRVGASIDSSFNTVFRSLMSTAKAAQKQMAEGTVAAAKQSAKARQQGAKEEEAYLKQTGKTAKQVADEMAKDVEKSAKERVRAEREANREVERDLKQHMREREKAEKAAGGGKRGGGTGTFMGVSYNRNPMKNDSILARAGGAAFGAGKRLVGDIASGLGVQTDLSSRIADTVAEQQIATKISTSGWIPSAGVGPAGSQNHVDAGTIMGEAQNVGIQTGTDSKDVLEGLDKFVALTGDLKTARESMFDIGKLAKANGAEFGDMAEAVAAVSNAMGDVPNKASALQAIMRTIAGQGQLSAIEIKDSAKNMGMITAQSNFFKIDPRSQKTLEKAGVTEEHTQRVAVVAAMAQMARGKGGRVTPKTAMQSAMAFVADMQNPTEIKRFKAKGLDVYTDKSHSMLRDPIQMMLEAVRKAEVKGGTGLNRDVLRSLFPNKNSKAVMDAMSQSYGEAYQKSTAKTDEAKHQEAIEAVTAEFQKMLQVTQSTDEVNQKFKIHMATTGSQVTIFNQELKKSTSKLSVALAPAVEAAGKALLSFAAAAADVVSYLTGTDKSKETKDLDSAEGRAIAANKKLKKDLKSGEYDEADTKEGADAIRALEGAMAAKQNDVRDREKNPDNVAVKMYREGHVEAARAVDPEYVLRKLEVDSFRKHLDELKSTQATAMDKVISSTLKVRVVQDDTAKPPGAEPATDGTTPGDAHAGAD